MHNISLFLIVEHEYNENPKIRSIPKQKSEDKAYVLFLYQKRPNLWNFIKKDFGKNLQYLQ